ncbi:hypothetical protein I203_106683 [Kwoniella mangroviensis CBS 8507]|uniref:uncharacterized protein n=2 Tax=Kwoniella TaxID=490731 RepID=UPI0030723E2C
MSAYQTYPQQGGRNLPGAPSERSAASEDDGEEERDLPPSKGNGTAAPSNLAPRKFSPFAYPLLQDYCHRMKMKCIGKENPPCNRCRQSKHPCTFDGPRKSKSSKVEDRLRLVEAQIGAMQGNLQELLQLQRGAAAVAAANTHPSTTNDFDANSPVHLGQRHHSSQTAHGPLGPPPWGAPPHHPHRSRAVPSPGPSDEDEPIDPLKSAYAAAPWANMLHLAEAARLKADSHIGGDDDQGFRPKVISPRYDVLDDVQRARKRPRTLSAVGDDAPSVHISLNERGPNGSPDPVDLGWCTLEKGRQFFERCGVYMPCFDPEYDTWDSLRKRSPFAITTIIAVVTKCEDAAGPPSELQLKSREHAEKMAMHSLFTPVSRIEIVQAMKTFWRPGGHAIRMAMDMGLHKSLAYLVEAGMGAGKTPEQVEADRLIVAGARVWLTLFKMEYE